MFVCTNSYIFPSPLVSCVKLNLQSHLTILLSHLKMAYNTLVQLGNFQGRGGFLEFIYNT